MQIELKNSVDTYEARLTRFLRMIAMVRKLAPYDHHMWKVMDTVAFEDTEAALKAALHNQRRKPANDE